jgi:hypothetical protein
MNLKSLDYTRPAEVHWRNPTPHLPSLGHHRRQFATLSNAIRFVMEDLTDFPQSTASISTERGNLTFVQTSAAYSTFFSKGTRGPDVESETLTRP